MLRIDRDVKRTRAMLLLVSYELFVVTDTHITNHQ